MSVLFVVLLLGQSVSSEAALAESVLHSTPERIEQAIRELSHNEFAVREQATLYLWCCGAQVQDALKKKLTAGDLEVRTRAKQILQAIENQELPKINDPKLRGVVQCRLSNWQEGREALATAGAFDLIRDLAEESTQVARANAEQKNLQFLKDLSDEDREKWTAENALASLRHDALKKRDWNALYQWSADIEHDRLRGSTLRLALLPEMQRNADAPTVLREVLAQVAADPGASGRAAGELIMAEHPADAFALNKEYSRISALRMYADDLLFREAFATVGIALPLSDPDTWMEKLWADHTAKKVERIHWAGRVWNGAFVALTAARLGEPEIGVRLMNKVSALAESNPDGNALATVWEHELAIGLADRAWQHLASVVKEKKPEDVGATLCWQHKEAATTWWNYYLATQPDLPIDRVVRIIVSLLDPKKQSDASFHECQIAIENLRIHAATLAADASASTFQAAAIAADIQKQFDLAHEIWQQAEARKPSSASALALADYFADHQRWDDAAAWYGRAWSRDLQQVFVLILQAHALEKSSREREAIEVRQLARAWTMGNDDEKMQIPFRLQFRNQMIAAREQYALASRLVEQPYNWIWIFMSQADAQAVSAPADAAESWNLVRFMLFRESYIISGDEIDGLYTGQEEIVQRVHHYRSLGHIATRNFDAAITEAITAHHAQPAGLLLPLEAISAFDRAGSFENGDKLFEMLWTRRQNVLNDFPKAAEFHEQLAGLGAACGRRLDKSLVHAQQAITLRPKHASSHLALARVQLARGDHEAAQKHLADTLTLRPTFHQKPFSFRKNFEKSHAL